MNEIVIAGDMANVPLEDESLDAAIFCLSLMGTNITDYILEAFRTLKLDGHMHIIESTSRFKDKEQFMKQLEKIGFMVSVKEMWKFIHIHAVKITKTSKKEIILKF
jgi:ubiquinone/menaquinone biosynthesis C-methylase UbiE